MGIESGRNGYVLSCESAIIGGGLGAASRFSRRQKRSLGFTTSQRVGTFRLRNELSCGKGLEALMERREIE